MFELKRVRNWLPILLIFIFAFLRGFFYLNFLDGREVYLRNDDAIYAILSSRFLTDNFLSGFHPYWNPGFSLATIPFYLITSSWETAQILVSMTSHIILIFVIYFTLRKISKVLALTTSFLVAFSPSFSKMVVPWGITEPLYTLLFWLAIYFGWQSLQNKKIKTYAIAGLFFGLAYLTRTEAIYTLVIFLIIAFGYSIFSWRGSKFSWKIFFNPTSIIFVIFAITSYLLLPKTISGQFTVGMFFASLFLLLAFFQLLIERNKVSLFLVLKQVIPRVGVLLILFLLVNLPYIIAISIKLDRPTFSGKYAIIKSGYAFTPEKDRLTTWAQDIWSVDFPNYSSPIYDPTDVIPIIWKKLDISLEAAFKNLFTYINFYRNDNIFSNALVYLTLFGFIAAIFLRRLCFFAIYLGVIWLVSFAAIIYFFESAIRYLAFSLPFFYLMQSLGIITILKFFTKRSKHLLSLFMIVFFIIFFSKNIDNNKLSSIKKTGINSDQKIIAEYLKSQGVNLVMARTEGIGLYANAKIVYVPAATPQTIVKFAKAWGVEYLIARPDESSWSYMRSIINPNLNNPDLILRYQFDDGTIVWNVKLTESEKLHNFRTDQDVNKKLENVNINSQTVIEK